MKEKSNIVQIYTKKNKIIRIMKISVMLIFLCAFGALAENVYSQQKEVSINLHKATIRQAFSQIEKTSDYVFLVADDAASELSRQVSIAADKETIDRVLNILLQNSNLGYRVVERQISVYKNKKTEQQPPKASVTVKGIVLDTSGEPLPGVTIRIKGTPRVTVTDANGRFSFSLSTNSPHTLLFTCIGMKAHSYEVKATKELGVDLKIVLKEDVSVLPEFVATGMQFFKKDRVTGSASVITAKDLRDQGITSIDRILEGRIPGLNSTSVSGAPGMRNKISIRGENSLDGNTEPLWILDGLPMLSGVPKDNSGNYAATVMQDGVGNVMPEDIESITILKDAAAAAIYGARAANGVIVITNLSFG